MQTCPKHAIFLARSSGAKRDLWKAICVIAGDGDDGVALAYIDGGYTQSAIAKALGLSVSRISRVIRAYEAKGKT